MDDQDSDDESECSTGRDEPVDVRFELSYSKFVNPPKKSEYTIRKWRVDQKFTNVAQLTSRLTENFDQLHTLDEQGLSSGYIEPGHGYKGKQRWICCDEDLKEMYKIYSSKREILMWCFLPGKRSKRTVPSDHAGSSMRTAKCSKVTESNSSKISEVQQIVAKLQSKHGSKYSPEQYHA